MPRPLHLTSEEIAMLTLGIRARIRELEAIEAADLASSLASSDIIRFYYSTRIREYATLEIRLIDATRGAK